MTVGLLAPDVAHAVPPPPRPGEGQIERERQRAREGAGRVGELTSRLARLESHLAEVSDRVELRMEEANKARVDLRAARRTADRAQQAARSARGEAEAASRRIAQQRARVDEFAAGSYQQGSTVGSVSAFFGARSPSDVLQRAQMLQAISDTQLDVMAQMQRARANQANKDAAARQALHSARARQSDAEHAAGIARGAVERAVGAQRAERAEIARTEAAKSTVEGELARARASIGGLTAQRERYQEWLARKREQEAATARRVAESAANGGSASGSNTSNGQDASAGAGNPAGAGHPAGSGDSAGGDEATGTANRGEAASSDVDAVVRRALAQVGTPYAWGGGSAQGPTRGVTDGGVADAHDDYRKIGFDCSGLMTYAFHGAGEELLSYSGYQYNAGTKVPLSQKRRGDMLFWSTGGRIHHVALYLGDGMMVEAPYSGSRVRVTSVRYGGIAPFAVRVL